MAELNIILTRRFRIVIVGRITEMDPRSVCLAPKQTAVHHVVRRLLGHSVQQFSNKREAQRVRAKTGLQNGQMS